MKVYAENLGQLVYIERRADQKFWDSLWNVDDFRKEITAKRYDLLVLPTTKKYLKIGCRILEGGCGRGMHVYALCRKGYDCVGVDYAHETVRRVEEAVPEIKVYEGDVRKLDFPDSSFEGYWSIGVIEHFFAGYRPILDEMKRVLKKGGILFLTFPYMSPFRKMKAKLGIYSRALFLSEPDGFYQFALDHKKVIAVFVDNGFELLEKKPFDGVNGLRDEVGPLNSIIRRLNNYQGKSLAILGVKFIVYKLFQPLCGHAMLLVFRKT